MIRWLNGLQPYGVLLLRLVLGVAMVYNGWEKVVPSGAVTHGSLLRAMDHYSHYIASLGMPYWLGYVSACTEFFGGMFLVVGLLTRFVAFLVAVNMLVALAMVNVRHGYAGSEYSLALFAIAVMLLLAGPGRPSLDRRMGLL